MDVAELQSKLLNVPHVDVVADSTAAVCEFGVFNEEFAGGVVAGQYAHLIVVEIAVSDDQTIPFMANTRTINIRHFRLRELDVFDGDVVATNHPNRFGFRAGAARAQVGLASNASQRQVVCTPNGNVGNVGARVYLDDVSVFCDSGRLAGKA